MLMKLSEATYIVEGMIHTYFLCTNVVHGDICVERAQFFITCAQNFECVHGTCPVFIDFFPYWSKDITLPMGAQASAKQGRREIEISKLL